ncbi:Mitochondrial import inner membrane translocase subunit TIM22-4 [Glycine soja]|uniref:Mitochondrial import inner membrane translocase subunit TIM22-4 n=1 Tax=Glycine soja TaxID=3848 RepID=A0A445LSX2_GLYSO|nr:Mitochondrial import inner membrane translocase subunit TIM22-4 [Glycine soja]
MMMNFVQRPKTNHVYYCGGGLGIFMGLFLGALDKPLMQEEMTGRQQLIYQAKQMGRRRWSLAKAFAVMGCIFSAAECVVEKVYWI